MNGTLLKKRLAGLCAGSEKEISEMESKSAKWIAREAIKELKNKN